MEIKIRKAQVNDLPFLIELERANFPEYQQSNKQSIKKSLSSPIQEVWIAETPLPDIKAVGSVTLFNYKKSIRIYSIATQNHEQNSGVGSLLIKHVIQLAQERRILRITLEASKTNLKLVDWYQKRGFEIIEDLPDFYAEGIDAVKMEMTIQAEKDLQNQRNFIVINQPGKWLFPEVNAEVISVKDYINNPFFQTNSNIRIFNLCSSYQYQSYGYYVSMLASARGQRVVPSIATMRDLKIKSFIHAVTDEIDELIDQSFEQIEASEFTFNIYFGKTVQTNFLSLAKKIYQLFESPLLKVTFIKHKRWIIKEIKPLTLNQLPEDELEYIGKFTQEYFQKKRFTSGKIPHYKYDLAILINPQEETPPSDNKALKKLKKIGNQKGLYVEFITKSDFNRINEFDALFIRETTNVYNHTYELSRLAFAEGLVVIDDPWSILKCSNKIYQYEIFRQHKIPSPKTWVLTKNMFNSGSFENMSFPLVMKQPDSAFSLGVSKVQNAEEATATAQKLFQKSDMLICQEFLYSDFDWRIGILDNKPLFACKYYMAKDHWQIYNWKTEGVEHEGDSETLPLDVVPYPIIKTALKAASIIGDGLYGVDLKLINNQAYVIEVNDNPNIDFGVEDLILQDQLYEQVIDSFIKRIESYKNIKNA